MSKYATLSLNKESTIFMKLRVSNNYSKDKNHLRYISTRPGAVQEKIERDEKHLGYMDERPRSTGIFGVNEEKHPSLKEAMQEVGNREDPTSWRLILSLKENDALALGYDTPEKWRDLTRRYMAEYARIIGYDEKQLNWVAAHHREPGHPHVHVLAWINDKAPKRKAFLTSKELKDCKRKLAQEVFGPARTQLIKEKDLARNFMIDAAKEDVAYVNRLIKEYELEMEIKNPSKENIIPSFKKKEIDELKDKIMALSKVMPGKGRAAYGFMPKKVKNQVDDITEWILQREKVIPLLEKYEKATLELTKMYTKNPNKVDKAWNNAYKDIEKRVGNVIVKTAAQINKEEKEKEFPEMDVLVHERRVNEAINSLENASVENVKNDEELKWTTGTMYRTLEYLGSDQEKAKDLAIKWGENAGIDVEDVKKIITKEDERIKWITEKSKEEGKDVLKVISKKDWKRLRENLGLKEEEFLRPWFFVRKEQEQDSEQIPPPEILEERVDEALEAIKNAEHRPDDEKELNWTVWTMASVMKALGVDEIEREEIVFDWCERANVGLSKARLRDTLDRINVMDKDDYWIGQRSWDRLMDNLGIEDPPEVPWNVEQRYHDSVRSIFKTVSRFLNQERQRAEAQAKLAGMRESEQAKYRARQSSAAIDRI